MDGGAWSAAVLGVAEGRTRLSDFTFHFHALEKEMATHSCVLAWRIPGTGEPGGLPSMGSHSVGHDRSALASTAIYIGHTNEATCLCAALYLVFEDILLLTTSKLSAGLPLWLSGKQSTCQCRRHEFKSLSWDDPLEKEMATHSSILAWAIPRSEEPGGLQSKASRRNQTELSD